MCKWTKVRTIAVGGNGSSVAELWDTKYNTIKEVQLPIELQGRESLNDMGHAIIRFQIMSVDQKNAQWAPPF